MHRYRLFMCAVSALALAGCINAPNDNGGGTSGAHGPGTGNGNSYVSGDVTADSHGAHTINGSVRVPDGERSGDVGTVHGDIRVGDKASIEAAETVNGSIDIGDHATADALTTVNGSISLDDGAHILHSIKSVNGSLTLRSGSEVEGGIANVNGTIRLNGAHVAGGIRTTSGDIYIEGASRVEGGILVQRPQSVSWFQSTRDPRVVIGPGSVVQGELRFERKVELYVSDKATIGPVVGATPVRYAGEGPVG